MAKIIICGDCISTNSNHAQFSNGEAVGLLGKELYEYINHADYKIFNVEAPFVEKETPIQKNGPNLHMPKECIHLYTTIGVNLVTLANNHIMDHGNEGLKTTIEVLNSNHINFVGVGSCLTEACKPYVFEFCGKRIGVYGCVEHEFSCANEEKAGANPFDSMWSFDHVNDLKKQVDYVMVLYHGGKEEYRYPSPELQKRCRRFIDKGADLVICQHSHCIGCAENYNNKTIVYGQGNFLFDLKDNEYWSTSLMIELDESFAITYTPVVKQNNGVRLAKEDERETILSAFISRSKELTIPGAIQENYNKLSMKTYQQYMSVFSGRRSILFRGMNKLSKGLINQLNIKHLYGKIETLKIENLLNCESHLELIIQGLKNNNKG